jgi:hypothetical protein
LHEWAAQSGIKFSSGVQVEDGNLILTEPCDQGDILIDIPESIILSSEYYDNSSLMTWMKESVGKTYIAECLLMLRVLEETSKGRQSTWYPWLQSLPTSFRTGIYWDERERSCVQQMAPGFLEQHMEQWQACSHVILSLLHMEDRPSETASISSQLQDWLMQQRDLEQVLKWAFSIVYTSSWKSVDGRHAIVVPFAGMLHHDVQQNNVQPCLRRGYPEALQLCLTEDAVPNAQLCISYGMGDYPARFLVNFGFVDFSTPFVDAHIKVDNLMGHGTDWPPIDNSELVVSTRDGAVSEEIWKLFSYKVLQQHDPQQLQEIKMAYENDESVLLIDELEQEVMIKWGGVIAKEIKLHFQSVLDNRYPPIFVSREDFSDHVNMKLIVDFNLYMREIFMKGLTHVNNELKQQEEIRQWGSLVTTN